MTKPHTYDPQPGTIPYRVIQHLRSQPKGDDFSTAQLAEALEIDITSLGGSMLTPVKHGLIARRKDPDTGLVYWRLGNGIPLIQPDDEDKDEPLTDLRERKKTPAAELAKLLGQPHTPRNSAKARAPAAAPAPAQDAPACEPAALRVGVFSDGSVTLERDGTCLALDRDDLAMVRAFIGAAMGVTA